MTFTDYVAGWEAAAPSVASYVQQYIVPAIIVGAGLRLLITSFQSSIQKG